jgi:hypothetical protein
MSFFKKLLRVVVSPLGLVSHDAGKAVARSFGLSKASGYEEKGHREANAVGVAYRSAEQQRSDTEFNLERLTRMAAGKSGVEGDPYGERERGPGTFTEQIGALRKTLGVAVTSLNANKAAAPVGTPKAELKRAPTPAELPVLAAEALDPNASPIIKKKRGFLQNAPKGLTGG